MANLDESSVWEETVKQIATTDDVLGGADGAPNVQALQLANRTRYLKDAQQADADLLAQHLTEDDPHPQYLTQVEGDARYQPLGGGGAGGVVLYDLAEYDAGNRARLAAGDRAFRLIDGSAYINSLLLPITVGDDELYRLSVALEHAGGGNQDVHLRPNDTEYGGEFTTQSYNLFHTSATARKATVGAFAFEPASPSDGLPLMLSAELATGKQSVRKRIGRWQTASVDASAWGTCIWHSQSLAWTGFGTLRLPYSSAKFWHVVVERLH